MSVLLYISFWRIDFSLYLLLSAMFAEYVKYVEYSKAVIGIMEYCEGRGKRKEDHRLGISI
jgi:hypothetical protein